MLVKDYEEDMSLFVFGETFLKYRHLFQNEYQLLIALQGEVRQERFSWRVIEVQPLESVLEKFAKRICLPLSLNQIGDGLAEKINQMFEQCSGEQKVDVDFRIADELSDTDVTLTMRKGLDIAAFCHRYQTEYPGLPMEVKR